MTHGPHQTYSARARRKVREIATAVLLTLAAAIFFLVAMQHRQGETVAISDGADRAHQN